MEQPMTAINPILDDIRVFLPRLTAACESMAKLLYQQLTDQTWQQFGDIVEGIDDLYRTLNAIQADMEHSIGFYALKEVLARTTVALSEQFQAMNQCMDNEDYVGASDRMKYELIASIEQLAAYVGEPTAVLEHRYVSNLTYFKAHYPQLYLQFSGRPREEVQYQLGYAKNGQPNLYIEHASACLYSQYDPAHEAQCWVESLGDRSGSKSHCMVFGFGFGYHVRAYADAYPEHWMYIYEPDEQVFQSAMSVVDFQSVLANMQVKEIRVGGSRLDRSQLFHRYLKYLKEEPATLALPVYNRIRAAEQAEFFTEMKNAIKSFDSLNVMCDRYGWQWVENELFNVVKCLHSPSIHELSGTMKEHIAVIAGAGPSLEADIETLRKLKEHAVIFAAGSTIQSLLHFGVPPHMIVAMDGTDDNYNAFKHVNTADIPLLFSPMVHHRIMESRVANMIHVSLKSDTVTLNLLQSGDEEPVFDATESVTGTAIQAAIYMGCQEIVFTGQDFSFPGASVYAPGAKHFSKQILDSTVEQAAMRIENVQGAMNPTNDSMMAVLEGVERIIAKYPNVRFTNTSQWGAKIKDTVWEPLSSVLERVRGTMLEGNSVSNRVSALPRYDEGRSAEISGRLDQLYEQLLANEQRLRKLDKILADLAALSRTNPNKCGKLMMDVNQEWHAIVHSLPFQALYVKVFRNEIIHMERDLPDAVQESSLIKRAELTRDVVRPLIQTLLAGTPALQRIIEEAIHRVNKEKQLFSTT
ncbi:motility associated factor glycosyltransferase family protein [Paenibacillus lycopersici]|uniref:Motility associated factor glycosyltransferase family protein n=1 Tax=Paenibacillus lycopersici TaxID=2704462 RepID=A0A6C0G6N5_9BACL|nr:6-hydroxymethylpterin diphosphokinase MptE-like protein [Paenibacillus lycopersici]QHT63440.1 motility associated factor glycosyltransferase family protein [Paenibacillus lycopersici]